MLAYCEAIRLQGYADSYQHISSNNRSSLPKRVTLCQTPLSSPGARHFCNCTTKQPCKALSDTCANAEMKYECNATNCQCTGCGNRDLQNGEVKGLLKIIYERRFASAGLATTRDLPARAFVGEYVGELVPATTANSRLEELAKRAKHSTYMFELGPSFSNKKKRSAGERFYVDALKMGNLTRFINHSCEPNCAVHKVIVNDEPRLAIYTRKAIGAGTPLSISYNFDQSKPFAAWACSCGAPTCSSTARHQPARDPTSLHAYTDGSHFRGFDVGGWAAVFVLSKRIPTPAPSKPSRSKLFDIRKMEEPEAATSASDEMWIELFGPVAKRKSGGDIFSKWASSVASNNSSELTGVAEALTHF